MSTNIVRAVCPHDSAHSAPSRRAPVCPRECDGNTTPADISKYKHMKNKSIIAIIAAALLGGTFAFAAAGVPKDYPLKKCPISGKAYGSGGMKAYKITHEGTDVWLCCKGCKDDFEKDPAKYAKMVKDAAKK